MLDVFIETIGIRSKLTIALSYPTHCMSMFSLPYVYVCMQNNITVSLLPNALECKTWLRDAIVGMHHLLLIGSKRSYTGALKFSSSDSIWE
jgi:hypothetical protein